jgi:large repetitive protein
VDVQFESWVSGGGVSHVELKIDDGKYKRLAPPKGEDNGYSYSYRTIKGLSDGTHTIYARTVDKAGNVDPSPAQWKFTVNKQVGGGGYPDTSCTIRAGSPPGEKMPNGGSTTSTRVIVYCKGTASGPGSYIELKLDNGRYKPVHFPLTITGLSLGKHTIYLRAVDQDGKADPTPAQWKFTVINDDD